MNSLLVKVKHLTRPKLALDLPNIGWVCARVATGFLNHGWQAGSEPEKNLDQKHQVLKVLLARLMSVG